MSTITTHITEQGVGHRRRLMLVIGRDGVALTPAAKPPKPLTVSKSTGRYGPPAISPQNDQSSLSWDEIVVTLLAPVTRRMSS